VTEPEYAAFADCWNAGRFFEAHEVLEGLWMRTRDRGQQGLIQIAAALYHVQRGNLKGARTMIGRALPRLRDLSAGPGPVDLETIAAFSEQLREALDAGNAAEMIDARPVL
jgi:predicted metal-dependent hydrolase